MRNCVGKLLQFRILFFQLVDQFFANAQLGLNFGKQAGIFQRDSKLIGKGNRQLGVMVIELVLFFSSMEIRPMILPRVFSGITSHELIWAVGGD